MSVNTNDSILIYLRDSRRSVPVAVGSQLYEDEEVGRVSHLAPSAGRALTRA